ncbi:DUF896 domain-containing protein [Paenibacillus xylanexedens]|uniref:DUF896 domain-containing protein n=1 Tax=Paenibacillus xylanexedens TaxID=528191 RepID=UPI0021B16524|nr:DUF896 domain-containing protein [Paenibacillus xylanexedens]
MEKEEQVRVGEEYVESFRGSVKEIVVNATMYDGKGDEVSGDKLKEKEANENNE